MEPSEGKHMNQMLAYFKSGNKGVTTVTPTKKDWLGLGCDKISKTKFHIISDYICPHCPVVMFL